MKDPKLETNGPSKIAPEALLQVSCSGCSKLHRVAHLLDSNPVCPTCAAR